MLPVKTTLLPTVSRFFDDEWNDIFDWKNRNYSTTNSTLPAVNIEETSDHFIVEMAVPGMKKEDFNIELDNSTLSIKVESKAQQQNHNDRLYTRREFDYKNFQRVFNLNHKLVDSQKIDASYQDGILCIQLAKKEEAKVKPARRITVS